MRKIKKCVYKKCLNALWTEEIYEMMCGKDS